MINTRRLTFVADREALDYYEVFKLICYIKGVTVKDQFKKILKKYVELTLTPDMIAEVRKYDRANFLGKLTKYR